MAASPTIRHESDNPAICTVHLPYNSCAVTEQAGTAMSNSPPWKQSQGQAVGKFTLKEYLGGSEQSAVFKTDAGATGQNAVIRLVWVGAQEDDAQLARWSEAQRLSHPNLLKVYASGRCEFGGTRLLYVVTEYADENLSQLLPQRALTPTEAKEMLPPILDALAFLHSKGYVHGGIRPSNIMAVGDKVKLSCDELLIKGGSDKSYIHNTAYDAPERASSGASPSMDVWALGLTLLEVLTQRLPERSSAPGAVDIPKRISPPFSDIVRNCLRFEPEERWTVPQISARLQGHLPVPVQKASPDVRSKTTVHPELPTPTSAWKRFTRWPHLAAVVTAFVVVAIIAGSIVWDSQSKQSQPHLSPAQRSGPSAGTRASVRPSPGVPTAAPAEQKAAGASHLESGNTPGTPLRPVYPDVPLSARNTIHGHVHVGVRVNVDISGNVVSVNLESAGPSKYFARLALESAREWKFTPSEVNGRKVSSNWLLRYAFGRAGTEIHAQRER